MAAENTKFVLSDKTYNVIKMLVTIWLPAFGALYFGLAAIWGLPAADKVVGSIACVTTFFGVTMHISSKGYESSGAAYDGTVSLTPNEDGTSVHFSIDQDKIIDKSAITLKVKSPKSSDNS